MDALAVTLVGLAAAFAFYFLPTIIANNREAHSSSIVLLFNVLFGWTIIGWFGCLIWACCDRSLSGSHSRSARR